MTAPKFTPGPWIFDDYDTVRNASGEFVMWFGGECVPGGIEKDADRHLIAAAPELYGQHESDLVDLDLLKGDIDRGCHPDILIVRVKDMIRRKSEALAKARGERS